MRFPNKLLKVFLDIPIYGKITLMLFLCLLAFSGPMFYAFDAANILRARLEAMTQEKIPAYKSGRLMMVELEHIRDTFYREIDSADLANVRHHLQLVSHDITSAMNIVAALRNTGKVTDKYTGEIIVIGKTGYDPDSLRTIETLLAGIGDGVQAILAEFGVRKIVDRSGEKSLSARLQALSEQAEQAFQLNLSLVRDSILGNKSGFAMMGAALKTKMQMAVAFVLAMVLLLVGASYLWGISLVKPLREILLSLGDIRYPGEEGGGKGTRRDIPVFGNDEIGQVAQAMNSLVDHSQALSAFRRFIEEDETPEEIYARLARVFRDNLNFTSFVIYIKDEKADTMIPAFVWPAAMHEELYRITPISICRVNRTGKAVDSLHHEGICAAFPWSDVLTHSCIPLIIGNDVIGVVQFLCSFVHTPEREARYYQNLNDARQFIHEAIPVLQSKLLHKKLKEMATRDSLTGLHNRHHLEEALPTVAAMAERRNTWLGILMCDLDYFKNINDQYGHDAGDLMLREMAGIILQCIRASDMAVRYGGEEFLVVLLDCQEGMAQVVAEKIHAAVKARSFMIGTEEVRMTVSIGVAEFPNDRASVQQVITCADMALYQAKERGRDRVVRFSPELT